MAGATELYGTVAFVSNLIRTIFQLLPSMNGPTKRRWLLASSNIWKCSCRDGEKSGTHCCNCRTHSIQMFGPNDYVCRRNKLKLCVHLARPLASQKIHKPAVEMLKINRPLLLSRHVLVGNSLPLPASGLFGCWIAFSSTTDHFFFGSLFSVPKVQLLPAGVYRKEWNRNTRC